MSEANVSDLLVIFSLKKNTFTIHFFVHRYRRPAIGTDRLAKAQKPNMIPIFRRLLVYQKLLLLQTKKTRRLC